MPHGWIVTPDTNGSPVIQWKDSSDNLVFELGINKIGFLGKAGIVKPAALTAKDTSITHTAPGTPDFAIQDLTTTTPFGFADQDEGNTVLQVILNLQTRVNELETKLQALGLLT